MVLIFCRRCHGGGSRCHALPGVRRFKDHAQILQAYERREVESMRLTLQFKTIDCFDLLLLLATFLLPYVYIVSPRGSFLTVIRYINIV